MAVVASIKRRDSNIELLRIIAMMLVMAMHANYYIFDSPSVQDLSENPIFNCLRVYIQGVSISGVDIFVLISGWFGINTTIRGGARFLFHSLYYIIGLYFVFVLIGQTQFTIRGLCESLLFVQDLDYWFVKAYLGLYIIAPILNVFANYADKKVFRNVLVSFYLFQSMYGWLYPSVSSFNGGYSIVSFIGLYLLARYFKLYPPKFTQHGIKFDVLILVGISIVQWVLSIGNILLAFPLLGRLIDFGGYINPITVIFSMYMVICFSKLKIRYKLINIMGSASYAVYLIHVHKCVFKPIFCPTVIAMAGSHFFVAKVLALFSLFFLTAVLLDQPRKLIWKFIDERFFIKIR